MSTKADRNFVLHIGTHKTGTSAIQRALRRSRAAIRSEGIGLLSVPAGAAKVLENDPPPSFFESQRASYTHQVKQLEDCHTHVLSWEVYSGDLENGYRNTDRVAANLAKIIPHRSPKIVVYLRRQDSFVESAYTQMVTQGRTYTFREFLERIGEGAFDWNLHLRHFEAAFPESEIIVRSYERARLNRNGGIIAEFAELIGSHMFRQAKGRDNTPGKDYSPNLGYSAHALEIARVCNGYLDGAEIGRLKKILKESNTKRPGEKYFYFSQAGRRKFIEIYNESNRMVAQRFLSLPDLFEEDLPDYPDEEVLRQDKLENNELAVVMARALIRQDRLEPYSLTVLRELESRFIKQIDQTPRLKRKLVRILQKLIGYE